MRSIISSISTNVSRHSVVVLPVALLLTSTASSLVTPIPHSLFVAATAWAIVWLYNALRIGFTSGWHEAPRTRLSLVAGVCIAGALLSSRAIRDIDGYLWSKSLLPAAVALLAELGISRSQWHTHLDDQTTEDKPPSVGSLPYLALVTICASLALTSGTETLQHIALAIGAAAMLAAGLSILRTTNERRDEKRRGGIPMSEEGRPRRPSTPIPLQWHTNPSLRDVAAVVALSCIVLSCTFESFQLDALTLQPQVARLEGDWKLVQNSWLKLQIAVSIALSAAEGLLVFALVNIMDTMYTSMVMLAAALFARAALGPTLWNVWFGICALFGILALSNETNNGGSAVSGTIFRRRSRLLLVGLGALSFMAVIWQTFNRGITGALSSSGTNYLLEDGGPGEPLQLTSKDVHPVEQMMQQADQRFQEVLKRQSRTLTEAVAEYRRRHGVHPPPNFDHWFRFAQSRGVKLIDEFDTVHETLAPFWGLEPRTIRARAKEALGTHDNFLIGMFIRGGEVVNIDNGEEWQQQATLGMMKEYVQHLPDMDLAFNMHDEPRVVVPNDALNRLMDLGRTVRKPKALANTAPTNAFSARPKDLSDGRRIEPLSSTRFNHFAHQATWTHSSLSCALDSPARSFEEISTDNITTWAVTDLGFVYNQTALADICLAPSLRQKYGFFDRPNAYNLVLELFPIFSQSKLSSYQDILYPSPWYWSNKVKYEEEKDPAWEEKRNAIYWRGSTTGSFARDGHWRRGHRQHVVSKMSRSGKVKVLTKPQSGEWTVQEVSNADLGELVDVHFSHVGQCDEKDCEAQKEYYKVTDMVDPQEAWGWKHLLDMDGNAFSGRFYAFLKSKSLVFKMAFFQEWHRDWLMPWIHYIPLSFRGDDWHELLRYFANEEEGKTRASKMATRSRQWANDVLRNDDFEVWFFRLLLEYGRLVDDNRESIGYPGP